MTLRRLSIPSVAALLLAFNNPVLSGEALTGAEIKALYSGAVQTGTTSRGQDFEGHYEADGTMRGSINGGQYTDTGKWRVSGNQYCRAWNTWLNGAEDCSTIERESGDNYIQILSGGRGTNRFTLRKK